MDKLQTSPRYTLAWAAYVVGHDIEWLRQWHQGIWAVRRQVRAGKLDLESALPDELRNSESYLPRALHEIDSAVRTLLELTRVSAESAYRLGQHLEMWRHDWDLLFIEYTFPGSTQLDERWEENVLPSSSWVPVAEITNEICKSDEWLWGWYKVGAWMVEKRDHFFWDRECVESGVAQLAKMSGALEGGNLGELARFLGAYSKLNEPPAAMSAIVDPAWEKPTPDRIAEFLRQTLKGGAAPEPWIVISPDEIHFLDTSLAKLPPRERAMFWLLCENPCRLITRDQIIKATERRSKDKYKPEDVPTIASRLREVLRTGVKTFLRRQGWDAQRIQLAESNCFIVGMPQSDRLCDYQLDLSPAFVVVRGDRPKGMKLRPTPRLPGK